MTLPDVLQIHSCCFVSFGLWSASSCHSEERCMSTAWRIRPNSEPVTNLCLKVGWLESSCPCLAKTYAPRTAGLPAGYSCLFFFLNSSTPGWSQGVGKQPPPPPPPSHGDGAQEKQLRGEEKVGGVNVRDLCPSCGHRAVFYPQEATDQQPNTEALCKTLEEERGGAARSDVDTEAPGGRLDSHSTRPDRKSHQKQITASSWLQECWQRLISSLPFNELAGSFLSLCRFSSVSCTLPPPPRASAPFLTGFS